MPGPHTSSITVTPEGSSDTRRPNAFRISRAYGTLRTSRRAERATCMKRILIIEDDRDIVELVRYNLAKDDRTWVFVMKDQPTIQVRWSGQRRLSVGSEGYSRTSREQALKTARWEDVEVIEERP